MRDQLQFYNINELNNQIGDSARKMLLFLDIFSGCDIVSSFFNQCKAKFLDCWIKVPNKTDLDYMF